MFATLVSVALFSAAALQGVAADLSIQTPTLVQCQEAQITWTKSNGPYSLAVVPPSDPCDTIADLGDHNGTSMKWLANLPAGTQVAFVLADVTGEEGWTGDVTVQASNDTSCLTAAAKSSLAVESSSSTGSATAGSATTLIVSPTGAGAAGAAGAVESGAPEGNTSGAGAAAATAAGAAAAGENPLGSGASALRPATAFVALAAAFMLAL